MIIRPAVPADAPIVADLARQLGYPASAEAAARRLEAIGHDPRAVALVAVLPDEQLVGWIYAYVCLELVSDARGEIGGLVVDEGHRNGRIGQALLREAEEWVRRHGCTEIGVHSNVIRSDAHRFYEREGYRVVKSQKVFRKEL